MKLALKIGVGLLALVIVLVLIVFVYIDVIAKTAIEKGATYALGVKTTLDKADVGVLSGKFTMKGLQVANPEGFDSKDFFQLGEGFVSVSLGSLSRQTVTLPLLTLSDLHMNLEKKNGKANYSVILDNLNRLKSPGDGGEPQTGDKSTGGGKDFVVEEILITNVNVEVDVLPIGGQLNHVHVPIDEIHLKSVGSKGLTTAQMTDLVIKAILAAVAKSAVDLPGDLANDLGGALASFGNMGFDSTVDIGGKTVNELGKHIGGAGDGIGKGLEDVGKGLGGLLGGKKDE